MKHYQHNIFSHVYYRINHKGILERKDRYSDWHTSALKESQLISWGYREFY